jgi:hypothetical protein
MYIEFELPMDWHILLLLKEEIRAWSEQYQIPHKIKVTKRGYRVILTDPTHYSVFGLTWEPVINEIRLIRYQFIEPMKVDKHR